MALTQAFPDFKLKSIPEGNIELPPVPRFTSFSFRKGGDLDFMAKRVCESGNFIVDAAPGTGKSTDFPQAILRHTEGLVVHVMPFPQLAAHLAEWHKTRSRYRDPVYIDSLEEEFPKSGYVITYAALVVAKWMQFGLDSLAGAILLQDESHESGAASAVIRELAPVSDLVSYVAMSATHSGGDFRALESRGTVADREYTPESFTDPWSVLQPGAPWAVDRIGRCTLILEDDEKRATELLSAYNLNNVVALRWTARTPVDRFLADLELIRTMDHAKFVILADSTYRSGYTLPVETIIDSGYVRRIVDIGDGAFGQVSRGLYQFEKHQTMARGGRTIGLSSSYYRPSIPLEAKRCIMEQTDIEAFVLILRVLGYACPDQYASARFSTGLVPKDVCAALNNGVPLSCVVDYQLSPISECITVDFREHVAVEEVIGTVSDTDSEYASVGSSEKTPPYPSFTFKNVNEMLEEITGVTARSETLSPAEFGMPLFDSEKSRLLMPEDVPRLVEAMRNYSSESMLGNVVKFVWSREERDMNCSVAAARYNYHLARFQAIAEALQDIKGRELDRDKVALTNWAKRFGEVLVICQSEMKMWFNVVEELSKGHCGFVRGPNLSEGDVESMKVDVYSSYNALPRKRVALARTSAYGEDRRLEDRFKNKLLEIG